MENSLNLSASQREAIECTAGVCEVIAGPGSGKTTVLIRHILFLICELHLDPSTILVLTFSREAALSMRQRFYREAEASGLFNTLPEVTFSTFHAFFYSVLRKYRRGRLSLITASERRELLKHLTEEYYPDEQERPLPEEIEAYLRPGSSVKYRGYDPAAEGLSHAYHAYLSENGLLDFDSILSETSSYLRDHPQAVEELRQSYSCIITDEMQDIDALQYGMLRMLAKGQRLFVVGDDDQSIYGFRRADPGIMSDFQKDFPDSCILFLPHNYRCAYRITEASLKIIRCNRHRLPKVIRAVRTGGEVHLLPCENEKEEMKRTADFLSKTRAADRGTVAVICRTNRQVMAFSHSLAEAFPEETVSGTNILQSLQGKKAHREILEDLRAYLSLSLQIGGGKILRRDLLQILNRPPRYLARSTAGALEQVLPEALLEALSGCPASQEALRGLLTDLKRLSGMKPVYLCRYLLESMGYEDFLKSSYPSVAGPVIEMLRGTALVSNKESEWIEKWEKLGEEGGNPPAASRIKCMTMHACKGLEFDTVLLPGLNEGIIPSRRSKSEEALEEERRLLYVAMTRAKNCLVLLFSVGTPDHPRLPSRFLTPLGVKMQGLNTPAKCGRMINPVGNLGRRKRK